MSAHGHLLHRVGRRCCGYLPYRVLTLSAPAIGPVVEHAIHELNTEQLVHRPLP
ncbi:hypothetical protein [Mycobacterium mantenii]|uniref:hypothetical protein n=1 Tax=Mycobacterium mantenii TaxID=560555 RepID=UPI000A8FA310|nr:hypothetical protein [Mycobacterium mantenii]